MAIPRTVCFLSQNHLLVTPNLAEEFQAFVGGSLVVGSRFLDFCFVFTSENSGIAWHILSLQAYCSGVFILITSHYNDQAVLIQYWKALYYGMSMRPFKTRHSAYVVASLSWSAWQPARPLHMSKIKVNQHQHHHDAANLSQINHRKPVQRERGKARKA